MDLKALREWAVKKNNDLTERKHIGVDANSTEKASTYLIMIANKTEKIEVNADQIDKYMKDVSEYLEQLHKIGLTPPGEEKNETTTVAKGFAGSIPIEGAGEGDPPTSNPSGSIIDT